MTVGPFVGICPPPDDLELTYAWNTSLRLAHGALSEWDGEVLLLGIG